MPNDPSTTEVIDGISDSESLADQELAPTSIKEWGKKKAERDDGVVLELPSGNVCKIRRTMDMMTMLQMGQIPNPLAGVVNKMIENNDGDLQTAIAGAQDGEATRQLLDLMDQQMVKAFVEPKVSAPPLREKGEQWEDYAERIKDWKPTRGTLPVHAIEMEDKVYVMAVAQGGAADLERFRREQATAMELVSASNKVVKPTKRTSGGKRKK